MMFTFNLVYYPSKKLALQTNSSLMAAENFSYFSYNNNLEKSFLSSLSQILQESNDDNDDMDSRVVEEIVDQDEFEAPQSKNGPQPPPRAWLAQSQEDNEEEQEVGVEDSSQVSYQDQEDGSTDSDNSDEHIFVQIKSNQKKPSKVVPLPSKVSKRRVKFQSKKAEVSDESDSSDSTEGSIDDDDVKEVEIGDGDNELEALVKQLVLLENESIKAQQFLQFIQQHNCFDKQDHKAVNHFLDMIEQEKKSLVVVLSNYSPQMQPLITMMTIAERRISLLDSCSFITPGSTLHATFLEKQQSLQDVIDQAASHVYGRKWSQ